MRKLIALLTAGVVFLALCGCNILETDNPPTLPKVELDRSSLTATVEYINGRTCRLTVSQGDSHFDGPYVNRRGEEVAGDTIHLTYTSLTGAKTLTIGDSITFTYHYTTDVSEKNGDPHISVNEIQVLP